MSYNWAPYQSATGCTRYGPAGAQALMTYLEDCFPGQASLGICNCRPVVGGSSWSHHAECRAYDEGFVVFVGQTIGIQSLELLGPHGRRLGLDHCIMNHQPGASGRGKPMIYSAASPNGRLYTGTHPHKNHNHWGLTRNAGRLLTYATLVDVVGPPAGNQGGFDMLAPCRKGDKGSHVKALQIMLTASGFDPGEVDGIYGNLTSSALLACRKSVGSSATSGDVFDEYAYEQLHQAHGKRFEVSSGGTVDQAARNAASAAKQSADKANARLDALDKFDI